VCAKLSSCSAAIARGYDLVRAGDLVADRGADGDTSTLRVDRSSVEGWPVAGGKPGSPLTSRNA